MIRTAQLVRRVVSIWALCTLGVLVFLGATQAQHEAPYDFTQPKRQCTSFDCRVLPSGDALALEQRLESRGWTCTEEAVITNTIVADTIDGAYVMGFGRAYKKALRGDVWIRAYCVRSA